MEKIELLTEERKAMMDRKITYPKKKVGEFDEEFIIQSVITAIAFDSELDWYITKKHNAKASKYEKAVNENECCLDQCMCLSNQIERGKKVFGMYLVEGRKILDELIQKGWPNLWKTCGRLRKNENSADKFRKIFSVGKNTYDIFFKPVIVLYYMYYFGFRDFMYPVFQPDTKVDMTALFTGEGNVKELTKNQISAIEEFCVKYDIRFDANDLDELLTENDIGLEYLFTFLNFPLFVGRINTFCVLGSSLSRKESYFLASALEKIADKVKKFSHEDILKFSYLIGYILSIISKEYGSLKAEYFKQQRMLQKLPGLKLKVNDDKRMIKELEKKQVLMDKQKTDIAKLIKENSAIAAAKRKIEAERDHVITSAIKENEKEFEQKEKKYQDRICMLEEILTGLTKDEERKEESVSFDEAIELIKSISGILVVCGDETALAKKKIQKLSKLADNIKIYSSVSDPVPSDISYIFFDYHLICHSTYHKIKNIGKKNNIPMYNIQSVSTEKNIIEMYLAMTKDQTKNK